jgi:Asp-tRNA(Asn)/Glu-tRNA(Gln) amidotransferase A subunit family amidase
MTPDRRQLFRAVAGLGLGTATFHRALVAQVGDPPRKDGPVTVTAEMVKNAEWVAGITLTDAQRTSAAASLTRTFRGYVDARKVPLGNSIPPALTFFPEPAQSSDGPRGTVEPPNLDAKKPEPADDLAFASVATLAHLLKTKQVSSVELTKLALERLKKYDPALLCVVSLTEELALKQAKQADEAIAAGKYRGPLHGIPWGAKDLIAYPGYKTTWGAAHYKDQTIDTKAAVAQKLDDAGAVLVAKLTLGSLALGDVWYGGMTRNPWNVKEGSSGSSAGSASAVAAGLVPFAIGSETRGSIVSPSTRCGATGLRPTFGRVSRHGCMTLSWTMDKLGPLCRSVEDCALVFAAIHGADPNDPCSVTRPFSWPGKKPLKELKVGTFGERPEWKVLKELGVELVPIKLPNELPVQSLNVILDVECAAAFDDLTRAGVAEGYGRFWGNTFRAGQFVTAVEYLRANRVRTLLMAEMAKVMEKVDLYVGGNDLFITNLTGHPTVCLPNGFTKSKDGVETPNAITFTGRLHDETTLLTLAHAFQQATGHHLKRPPMDKVTKENATEKK